MLLEQTLGFRATEFEAPFQFRTWPFGAPFPLRPSSFLTPYVSPTITIVGPMHRG